MHKETMAKNKSSKPERQLTVGELEIMEAVWQQGEATVRDVLQSLPNDRKLAYTSVATVMKILEQKGFLKSSKSERTHTYQALIARNEYEGQTLRHITNKLFRGSPSSLVMRLLDESDASEEELKSLRQLLDERLENSRWK